MHLHESLTHIQSQIKPRLLFGESFTLSFRQTFNKSTDDSQDVKLMSDSAPQYEAPAFYISGHLCIVTYCSVNDSGDSLPHLLLKHDIKS